MFNKVILIGRLVADPQIRHTQSGKSVANFRLAVDRPSSASRMSDGQDRQADFIDIVTWDRLAELCSNYLRKGRLVAIDGRLQIREFDGQDGTRRRVAEVVANDVRFLDRGTPRGDEQSPYPHGERADEFRDSFEASGEATEGVAGAESRGGSYGPHSYLGVDVPNPGNGGGSRPRWSFGTSEQAEGRDEPRTPGQASGLGSGSGLASAAGAGFGPGPGPGPAAAPGQAPGVMPPAGPRSGRGAADDSGTSPGPVSRSAAESNAGSRSGPGPGPDPEDVPF